MRGEALWWICQTLWPCETWWTLAIRCRWRDNSAFCETTSTNLWLTHHISNTSTEDSVTGQQRKRMFWSTTICHTRKLHKVDCETITKAVPSEQSTQVISNAYSLHCRIRSLHCPILKHTHGLCTQLAILVYRSFIKFNKWKSSNAQKKIEYVIQLRYLLS